MGPASHASARLRCPSPLYSNHQARLTHTHAHTHKRMGVKAHQGARLRGSTQALEGIVAASGKHRVYSRAGRAGGGGQ